MVIIEYTNKYERGKLKTDSLILDWLGNQKNNIKSIDDFTYDTTKKIIGLKKDGYMFYFMSDGTEIERYNINYELAGGTNEENAVMSYSKGDTVQLPIPTKEGAYFLGWSRNNNDAENTISNITSDMEGDITLYACWLEETSKDYFNFSTNSDGQTTAIIGFTSEGAQKYANGEIKELILPTTDKNGLQVTKIGKEAGAFSGRDKIERLVIPENVTELVEKPFENCTGIKYLQIPISTNYVNNAFLGVTNIEEIDFSKGTGVGFSLYNWQIEKRTMLSIKK
ncbi:MAG: InlB B-repeat-containing protein [Clostridia bacterium]|nr:InlB B-repeat-containing protein [Clostridia bacterium]